jgi:hypothetical protein
MTSAPNAKYDVLSTDSASAHVMQHPIENNSADEGLLNLQLKLAETRGVLAARDEERLELRLQVARLQNLLGRALLQQGSRTQATAPTGERDHPTGVVSSAACFLHACILQLQNATLSGCTGTQ